MTSSWHHGGTGDEVKAQRPFSWGHWFGGSGLAAILCYLVTLGAFFGLSFVKAVGGPLLILVVLLPSVTIAALAYRKRDGSGFLEGVITGACLVAFLS